MDERVKKIAVGVCCFLGVMVILCFVGWIILSKDDVEEDTGYDDAIGKLTAATLTPEPKQEDPKSPDPTATPKPTTAPTATPKPTAEPKATEAPKATTAPKTTATPKPTAKVTPKPTAKATPKPTKVPKKPVKYGDGADDISLDNMWKTGGYVIAIDAAHQAVADTEPEPVAPGATETRRKQSWGATGVSTGASEYAFNLYMAQKLRAVLEAKGYEVIMIRETNDVNICESERAKIANDSGADIVIHLHANADDREDMKGAMCFAPSTSNPYLSKSLANKCIELGEDLLDGIKQIAGAKRLGVVSRDNLTALNYTDIPAIDLEIGYMSNPEEDELLQTQAYQNKIIMGIAEGIDTFFEY